MNPATELAASVMAPLPARNEQLQTPFSTQALFWRPHHPAMSPALGQIPFLFWLTETVRPRTIVQFGIGDGVIYMGLCQGSERLGDSTICLGIQAEEPLLPPAMRAQHDARYSDFSELRHGDIRTSTPHFAGEIDLLVLNQALDADALARFRSSWLPRLSDRSVILLCNPETVFSDEAAREILFPGQDRSIVFAPVSAGGHAVEAILHGKEQAERLVALASQRPGEHAYLVTRQVFNRLGQGIEAIQRAQDIQEERDSLRVSLKSTQENLKVLETELGAQQVETKTAREAETAEVSRQAEMVARLYDVELLLSEKSQQAILLNAEKTGLESRIAELAAQTATREAEHKAALEMMQQRETEMLAALRAERESFGTAKTALEAQLGALGTEHEGRVTLLTERHTTEDLERKAKVEALRHEKSAVEAQLGEVRAMQEAQARQAATLAERYEAEASERKAEIEALRHEKSAVEAQLDEARAAQEEQARQAAILAERHTAEASERKAEIEALRHEKSAVEAQLDEARAAQEEQARQAAILAERHEAEASERKAEIEAARHEKSAIEAQLGKAQTAHEDRIEDIALLTGKYNDDIVELRAELETLRAARALLETQVADVQAAKELRIRELEGELQKRDQRYEAERNELNRRGAELSAKLDAVASEAQQRLAGLHRTAGEELGRVVKALLPAGKNGFLAKKTSLPEQAKLLIDKGIVEPGWYLEHHADVAAAGMDPAVHYLLHGAEEGRLPRRRLDEATRASK
jgi:chromosome segregation ATPase